MNQIISDRHKQLQPVDVRQVELKDIELLSTEPLMIRYKGLEYISLKDSVIYHKDISSVLGDVFTVEFQPKQLPTNRSRLNTFVPIIYVDPKIDIE